eukprot:scaffold49454_cov16-Tisochrysis_lutea.AAC.2
MRCKAVRKARPKVGATSFDLSSETSVKPTHNCHSRSSITIELGTASRQGFQAHKTCNRTNMEMQDQCYNSGGGLQGAIHGGRMGPHRVPGWP